MNFIPKHLNFSRESTIIFDNPNMKMLLIRGNVRISKSYNSHWHTKCVCIHILITYGGRMEFKQWMEKIWQIFLHVFLLYVRRFNSLALNGMVRLKTRGSLYAYCDIVNPDQIWRTCVSLISDSRLGLSLSYSIIKMLSFNNRIGVS